MFLNNKPKFTAADLGATALIFWGTLSRVGATLGDLHALENLSQALARKGRRHCVVSEAPFPLASTPVVRADEVDFSGFERVVFVCGPLVDERKKPLARLLQAAPRARKLAVGVSVIDGERSMRPAFDEVLVRDGAPGGRFDLALARYAGTSAPAPAAKDAPLALCVRGKQKEYGEARPALHEPAEAALTGAAALAGGETFTIDTVLRGLWDAERIEADFGRARAVLTTRMHASLYALAAGRPPLAVDQVSGGAKVTELLRRIGWEAVWPVAEADERVLADRLAELTSDAGRPQILDARSSAIAAASAALDEAVRLVLD
jgi:hypothetical protein